MSRYLNEGAVWSAIKRIPHITIQTRQAILEALRKVPSAHVAEVVLCRECKHYNQSLGYCDKHSYYCDSKGNSCRPEDSPEWTMFLDNDFCSYGERIDGGVKE